MSRKNEILKRVDDIETLPAAALEAVRMMDDPDVSTSRITTVIEHDPGLTTNILRMANSAYFGFPRAVSSVQDAIVRLGLKEIRRTILASAVAPIVKRPVKGYDLSAGKLWEHAMTTAVGTDQIAAELDIVPPDYTFTAGLLHDVGKIVLGTFIDVDAEPIMKLAFDEHVPFEIAEQRILGIDHAETGAALLEKWQLPVEIVEVCRWHHEPDRAPDSAENPALDLVHIADTLSMMSGIGVGRDGLNYRPSEEVVGRLGLSSSMCEDVICRMIDIAADVRRDIERGKKGVN